MNYNNIDLLSKVFKLEGKPFCVLDFETSKSEDNNPGLPIQVGALDYDNNHNVSLVSKYINQGEYNPEIDMINTKTKYMSITDLTGVTKANLQSEEFASERICEQQLVEYNFVDKLIIGYNIAYDVRTLKEVYKRCKVPFEKVSLCDVMAIFIDLYGNIPGMVTKGCNRWGEVYYGDYKLENVAHKLGVMSEDESQTHQGFDDVELTLKVLQKIISDHPDLDFTKYINKIYYNPCYPIPAWQRLTDQGVCYYVFGTDKKEGRIWQPLTLYNYENFDIDDF